MNGSITVIMPAFNAAETINESIQSILSQPLVTELIVVDDKSSDDTAQVALMEQDERVRVITGPGQGISAALNCGFLAATGEFIARCDADDLYAEERLDWQLAWLREHNDYAAISGGFQTITQGGKPVADLACTGKSRDVTDDLLNGVSVTTLCAWLIRTEAVAACGGARAWFNVGEDLDLQFRLAQIGRVWHEPKMSYLYRLHDNSITHNQNPVVREFYEASATTFAKQRIESGTDVLESGTPPPVPQGNNNGVSPSSRHIITLLVGAAWEQHQKGNKWAGARKMLEALKIDPLNLSLWKSMAAIIVKP